MIVQPPHEFSSLRLSTEVYLRNDFFSSFLCVHSLRVSPSVENRRVQLPESQLTFEGNFLRGRDAIVEKLVSGGRSIRHVSAALCYEATDKAGLQCPVEWTGKSCYCD